MYEFGFTWQHAWLILGYVANEMFEKSADEAIENSSGLAESNGMLNNNNNHHYYY